MNTAERRAVAEHQLWKALQLYEREVSRSGYASRARPAIARHGIFEAVDRTLRRKARSDGYAALFNRGLEEFVWERTAIDFPEFFSAEAVKASMERVGKFDPATTPREPVVRKAKRGKGSY